ncbi:MAG: hypothetical protein ACSHX3_01965 [Litorimonas sp.]
MEKKDGQNVLSKALKKIKSYPPIIGVLSAASLTVFVTEITDLSRYEFLRAFHAILTTWSEFTDGIGQVIGLIPFVPVFPGWFINAIIVSLALVRPSVKVAISTLTPKIKIAPKELKTFEKFQLKAAIFYFVSYFVVGLVIGEHLDYNILGKIALFSLLFFAMYALHIVFFWYFSGKNDGYKRNNVIATILATYVIFGNFSAMSKYSAQADTTQVYTLYLVPTLLLMFFMFIIAMRQTKFRQAFFIFVGFIVCMEVLYWLKTPGLSDWVNKNTEIAFEQK